MTDGTVGRGRRQSGAWRPTPSGTERWWRCRRTPCTGWPPTLPAAGRSERLFALKDRPTDGGPAGTGGRTGAVAAVAGALDRAAEHLAGRYWPGPLTLVVPRRRTLHRRPRGSARGPAHGGRAVARPPGGPALCRQLGPLAVTSANRHGAAPATSADEVAAIFAGTDELAMVLDGGICDGHALHRGGVPGPGPPLPP